MVVANDLTHDLAYLVAVWMEVRAFLLYNCDTLLKGGQGVLYGRPIATRFSS